MDLISLTTAGGLSMDTLESHSSEVSERWRNTMLIQLRKYLMPSATKRDILLFECCRVILELTCSSFLFRKSGWESISGESHLSALLRGEVFLDLATFGHDKAHIRSYLTLSGCLYCCNAVNTSTINRNGFESILKLYREADIVQEKEPRLLCCIAYCPDPNIVREFLNFMLSDEVQNQDIIFMLSGISSESHEVVWRWLKVNHTKRELHSIFIQKLYRESLFEELLQEQEELAVKRKQTREMYLVLQQAMQTLEEVESVVLPQNSNLRVGTDTTTGLPRIPGFSSPLPSTNYNESRSSYISSFTNSKASRLFHSEEHSMSINSNGL